MYITILKICNPVLQSTYQLINHRFMEQVFIGFGANLGDRFAIIKEAIRLIHINLGEVVSQSSLYESEPWGYESNELFVNGVLEIATNLSPLELLLGLKGIESTLGRKEKTSVTYSDRLIDLDILYYSDKNLNMSDLIIPHPHIYKRRFVLEPLVEIAPNFIDLRFYKTTRELLKECSDTSVLKKIVF